MGKDKLEKFSVDNATFDLERVTIDDVIARSNSILFDTNFLFVTFEFHIDIIAELRRILGTTSNLFIYEGTIEELRAIERKGDKNKKYLPLIVKMLHIYGFKVISSGETYVDDQILANLHSNVLVATNDKQLRQRIKKKWYKVLYLRQKQYLEIS